MNKKKFIWQQIKEMLPVYIITIILLAAIFWLTSMNSRLAPSYYSNYDGAYYVSYSTAWPPLFAILIPSLLASMALPFICFIYQRKRVRADFFYQLPFKKKEYRRYVLLINLVILLVAITIIYWIGVLIMFCQQIHMNSIDEYLKMSPFYYNYLIFIAYYFYLIICIGLNFFISAFFISLGTRTIDSILYLIFGQLFIAFIFMTLVFAIWGFNRWIVETSNEWIVSLISYTASPSWLEIVRGTIHTCIYMAKGEFNIETGELVTRIVSICLYLLLGGLATWYMLFIKKDPSGEYAGKGVPTNTFTASFPHAFAFMLGIYVASIGAITNYGLLSIPSISMSFIMWGIAYYFYIVLTNGGFHFNKKHWIAFGSVAGFTLMLSVAYIILYNIQWN